MDIKQFEEFQYIEVKHEITILKYMGRASFVIVPENIDNLPVTIIYQDAFRDCNFISKIKIPDSVYKLGDYSFCACSGLTEFSFHKNIEEIGRHAFYNCRGLRKLELPDVIKDIGDGAFKNCEQINQLVIKANSDKLLSLKYTLDSLSQNVFVRIIYYKNQIEEKAALVFPKDAVFYAYYTSRLYDKTTFGIGNQYHYCIGDGTIDYSRYDSLFLGAKNELEEDILCQIALARVMFPYKLEQIYEDRYKSYINEKLNDIVYKGIDTDNIEILDFITKENLIKEDVIEDYINYARDCNKIQIVSYLLTYQNQNFNKRNREFIL